MDEKLEARGTTEVHDPHAHYRHGGSGAVPASAATVRDPVCGMNVNPGAARFRADEGGETYYFCGPKCCEKFEAEPARYITAKSLPPAAQPPAGISYICAMHPQIRKVGPGVCPICGMALGAGSRDDVDRTKRRTRST